ncbi:MAG: hypothetical protein ABII96_10315 [Candidatus Zixiibacteriota bacterium]
MVIKSWARMFVFVTLLLYSGIFYSSSLKANTCIFATEKKSICQQPNQYLLFFPKLDKSIILTGGDSIHIGKNPIIKKKDPYKVFVYALVPGIVVHGIGHFYAKETTTGWILVGGEVLSLGILTYAAGVGLGETIGGQPDTINDDVAAMLGFTLFAGTWLYDLIDSPLAVQRYNRKILENMISASNLVLRKDTIMLVSDLP